MLFGEKILWVINFQNFHVIWLSRKNYLIRLCHYHRKYHQRPLLYRHGMHALGMVARYACATPREINSPSPILISTNFISKEGFSNKQNLCLWNFLTIWCSKWLWADNVSLKPSLLHELKTASLPHPLTYLVWLLLSQSCFISRNSFMPGEATSPILSVIETRNKGRFHGIYFDHHLMVYKIRIRSKNPAS